MDRGRFRRQAGLEKARRFHVLPVEAPSESQHQPMGHDGHHNGIDQAPVRHQALRREISPCVQVSDGWEQASAVGELLDFNADSWG